jgi:monoamine oxidase
MADVRECDVAVVGAGLAGLVAARALVAAGASAVVVEARERVGGRLLNADLGDGQVVELGGQWVGPTQDRVLALARELGVGTHPTHTAGANLLADDGEPRRYTGAIPRVGPAIVADFAQLQLRLERLARRVDAEAPWRTPDAHRLDAGSLESWLRGAALTRRAPRLVGLAARTIWGAEPRDLSLLHALFYVRSAGGFSPLVETEGGAQQDRVEGGSQVLALRLAGALGDERVRLGAPVRRIAHDPGGVTVHAGDGELRARRAIVAVPPNLAGRIAYDPPLPALRDELTQRATQGALRKCMAVYDEPFWREDGLSGEALSASGPATLTFDNSPPSGRPGVLLGFVGGPEERTLGRLRPEERRGAVLAGLARLFGPRALEPRAFLEHSWSEEEWSRGGPTCYMPPGAWTACGPALRAPLGPLHWAGTETATRWCGFMDGAVRSGERAAAEALAAL